MFGIQVLTSDGVKNVQDVRVSRLMGSHDYYGGYPALGTTLTFPFPSGFTNSSTQFTFVKKYTYATQMLNGQIFLGGTFRSEDQYLDAAVDDVAQEVTLTPSSYPGPPLPPSPPDGIYYNLSYFVAFMESL